MGKIPYDKVEGIGVLLESYYKYPLISPYFERMKVSETIHVDVGIISIIPVFAFILLLCFSFAFIVIRCTNRNTSLDHANTP